VRLLPARPDRRHFLLLPDRLVPNLGSRVLRLTDGWGRRQRDYYVQHDQPKRLCVRELTPIARRSLQAEHLKPALAGVERKAGRHRRT